jgi:hypothetical protein
MPDHTFCRFALGRKTMFPDFTQVWEEGFP